MKKKFRILLTVALAVLFAVSTVNAVSGISIADASEPLDTDRKYDLTVLCRCDGEVKADVSVVLYAVAYYSPDYTFTPDRVFAPYSLRIDGISSQTEWKELTETLNAYVVADRLPPTAAGITAEDGTVSFTDLRAGIWYVRMADEQKNEGLDKNYTFDPFVVSVPGLGEDGLWLSSTTAIPKPGQNTPPEPPPPGEHYDYRLVKSWRNDSADKRPASVNVDIFRGNELYESVILTAENQWTYAWTSEEYYEWTVVERDVAEGYTVTVSQSGQDYQWVYQVTNSFPEDAPPAPPTGDATHPKFWMILTAVSGSALLLLAFLPGSKKKRNEEDEA